MSNPVLSARRGLRATRNSGFSLIEIMVGIAIAMVGVVIMLEVLIISQRQAVTTGSGNDALSSGAIMMHMLERDLMQAGYGLTTYPPKGMLGCNVALPSGATIPLAPILINPATSLIPAGDANTDRLLVFYGNDDGQPEGNVAYPPAAGNVYTVQAPSSFHVGDYVIAFDGSCAGTLAMVTVSALSTSTVTAGATGISTATTLFNLGRAPTVAAYRVRNGALETCNFLTTDCTTGGTQWSAISGNIVSLRAQYGVDSAASGSMDGIIDTWSQTIPTTACGWVRTPAVRVAMVARSDSYESKLDASGHRVCDTVTAAAPTWMGAASNPVVLSGNTDWQCYRYQTFENVVPTRNIIWMGTQAGC